jgi:Bacterial regulatory protein, Fis family
MQTSLESTTDISHQTTPPAESLPASIVYRPTDVEARIGSLRALAFTLLNQIELLEAQLTLCPLPDLDLQTQVRRYEATLIRNALIQTGGRQRRAAHLLGVKVTTLNSKIKRLAINAEVDSGCAPDSNADIEGEPTFQIEDQGHRLNERPLTN